MKSSLFAGKAASPRTHSGVYRRMAGESVTHVQVPDLAPVHIESDASTDTTQGGEAEAKGEWLFNAEKGREAAKRRWAKEREQRAQTSEQLVAAVDDQRLVLVPVSVGLVIQRLDADARKGSTQAARELRAWLESYPPQDESFDPQAVERRTRLRLMQLLEWVAEDDARWSHIERTMNDLQLVSIGEEQ